MDIVKMPSFMLPLILIIIIAFIPRPTAETFTSFQKKTNIVIITSVIHTHSSNLSYAPRSVLTPQERFEQTIQTINSINRHVPSVHIVLIEGSKITKEEEDAFKSAGAHQIINCAHELASDINGPHKTIAEIKMILFGLNKIGDLSGYNTFSKISGRYYLTSNFSWRKYPLDGALYQCETPDRCNTRYYRIPREYFDIYRQTLEDALKDPEIMNGSKDIEGYNIYKNFPEATKLLQDKDPLLGVRGYIAPWGREVEDFINY